MCRYFCIGFIDFMLKGKSLIEYTNLYTNILPSNQQQIIEQEKFTQSPLGKAFEKQSKTIKDHSKKQVEALENLKPIERSKAIKYDDESLEQKQEHLRCH